MDTGTPEVAVVGHIGRDIVLKTDGLPDPGQGTGVRERREMLGGKGANQALGLRQLGHRVALVAAVGDDEVGRRLLDGADRDGIDVGSVARREGCRSTLIVSVVEGDGSWRYFEDMPPGTFVRPEDVHRARAPITAARAVSLQMQEPWDAVLEAGRLARQGGALVVADGAPAGDVPAGDLLEMADVVRADHREAELITGQPVTDGRSALAAARRLASRGPGVVVLAAGQDGNAVAWPDGGAVVPHTGTNVVDTTGGGDAFVAGLVSALLRGRDPLAAACLATAAAGAVVSRLGGRPELTAGDVQRAAEQLERQVRGATR